MRKAPLMSCVILFMASSANLNAATESHGEEKSQGSEKIVAALAPPNPTISSASAPHWSYAGHGGPSHWAALDQNFAVCETGGQQSPINVTPTIRADLSPIYFNYNSAPTAVLNNGHTLQVNILGGNGILVDGKKWPLIQFHFHTPSEYQIEGKSFPLEIHFVHKDENGALAVIGVMVKEGAPNLELEEIFQSAPAEAGKTLQLPGAATNLKSLLPVAQTYYRFMGSLTTPPCSEGVHWHMMNTPIEASKAQIDKFRTYFPANARPLQASNNRLVVMDAD